MSLLDMLFNEGPVRVADLDHEQYGEAAAMKRQGLIVLEGNAIQLTKAGALFVVEQNLRSLEQKGLVINLSDGSAAVTSEGEMIFNGRDGPVM